MHENDRFGSNGGLQAMLRLASAVALLAVGCGRQPHDQPDISQSTAPLFANGGFEDGTRSYWSLIVKRNTSGLAAVPPGSYSQLQLQSCTIGTNCFDYTYVRSGATPESVPLYGLSAATDPPKLPKFGAYSLVVNEGGRNYNVNTIQQSYTPSNEDVDPADGKIHVRFALAPALQNPGHADSKQPYFYVILRNSTRGTTLYQTFNFANESGIPWSTYDDPLNGAVQYTPWQIFDVAPGNGYLTVGDTLNLEVVAAGCAQGGHWGEVAVDGFGAQLPTLSIGATGPASANAGTDITYTFLAKNATPFLASNVVATETTPPNTTFVSMTPPPGITCTMPAAGSTGTISCPLGWMNPAASATFQVTVHINPIATGVINNGNYTIGGDGVSPLLGPKIQTTITSSVTYADLGITVSDGIAGIGWSRPLTYTILVTNQGPSVVTGATVVDVFPAQLTGVTWSCVAAGGGSCGSASGTGNISGNVNLPVGATAAFTVNANVVSGSGSDTLINTVTVAPPSGVTDPSISNNADADIDGIGTLYTLTVDKVPAETGRGTVTSSPAAINCDTSCNSAGGDFLDGTLVSLTAVARSGDTFTGWTGACTGISNTCNITVLATTSVTAHFDGPSVAASIASGSGTLVCDTPVLQGTASTCLVGPALGWMLELLTDDSSDVTSSVIAGSYVVSNVTASHTVVASFRKALGTACGAESECHSGQCIDGVCCNDACGGQCQACDVLGYEGTCTPVSGVPHGSRAACTGTGMTCGGSCNGVTTSACTYPGSGTNCRTASCTVGVGTLAAGCDGAGHCPAEQTLLCTPYVCGPTACLTSCSADGDCINSDYCSGSTCIPKQANGQICSAANQCTSGLCVDGVCCNAACTGQCQACDVVGAAGTCAAVSGAPHGSRTACTGAGTTCGGSCNGVTLSACTYPGSGTNCRAASCTAGVETLAAGCNGTGSCPSTQTQNCTPYVCGSTACLTSCSADGDCTSGDYCSGVACVPKQANGQACSAADQCTSGLCVDGVCCNAACNGQCEACDGAGSAGTCTAVSGAPHGSRTACTGAGTTCGGSCNGATTSTCTYPGSGASCRAASCAAGVETLAAECDGAGHCPTAQTRNCTPYVCDPTACLTSCSADGQCAAGFFCSGGSCTPVNPLGTPCGRSGECASGLCVDGVCCDTTCAGQCQACDVASSLGTCTAVSGTPHGSRNACVGAGTTCGGSCDGTATSNCTYPGDTQTCRDPSCTAGAATLAAACDGAGHCPPVQTQPCAPYTCGLTFCQGNCAANGDCAAGTFCASGVCEVKLANGTACAGPNQCQSGFCVDGVCCNTTCAGQCQACDVADSLGLCTTVVGAPHGVRPVCVSDGSTCGGACDGMATGSCSYPDAARVCRAASCASGVATIAAGCDGAGHCPAIQTQPCAPNVCGPTACLGDCTVDAQCMSGSFCAGGICVPQLTDGTPCGGPNQCQSGFCVDGVCCNTTCSGQCQACDAVGLEGTCSPVLGSPHGARTACAGTGSTCTGSCDGVATDWCSYPAGSVECRAAKCTTTIATLAASCDGGGHCPAQQTQSCAPYTCGSTACLGNCSADGDCAQGYFCSAGVCAPQHEHGVACSGVNQCLSGFCIDGVCCNAACNGQCEACDVPASVGTCAPVLANDAPHAARPACSSDGSTCGGACDGTTRTACLYPNGVICRAASCMDGVATRSAVCDGTGACPAFQTDACGAYRCASDTCGTTCTADSDCADDYGCFQGVCRSVQGMQVRGSGGCSGAGASSYGPLAFVALLLLGGRRRRGRLAVLALALVPTMAKAQSSTTSFTVQRFQPAAGAYDVLGLSSARVPDAFEISGVLFLNYADRPLRLVSAGSPGLEVDLVRSQTALDLGASIGLGGHAEVSLILPLILSQSSQAAGSIDPVLASAPGGGASDLRLIPKVRLWENGPFALAATLPLTLPTAGSGYLGQGSLTATPTAIAEWQGPRGLRAIANLGVVLRGERTLLNLKVGPAVTTGVGAEMPFGISGQSFCGMGTLSGEIGSGSGIVSVPLELLFGVRWNGPYGIAVTIGGGPGLTDGYGSPRYRLLGAVAFAPLALVRPASKPPPPEPLPEITAAKMSTPRRDTNAVWYHN